MGAPRRVQFIQGGDHAVRGVGRGVPDGGFPEPQIGQVHRLRFQAGELQDLLVHPAGGADHHDEKPSRGQLHQLGVGDDAALRRGVLDDRHLVGQLGQQADGAGDQVVDVQGTGHEGVDRSPFGRGERFYRGELVDEEPVALVGGDAPGAGVGLGDVALLLEHGHVVAHSCRGDPELVSLHEGLGTDGFPAGHVIRDDGAQHLHLPLVEHGHLLIGTRSMRVPV